MKKILLITLMFFGLQTVRAQYQHALGLRAINTAAWGFGGGSGPGLSFKTFLSERNALDFTVSGYGYAVAGVSYGWFSLTGLFEIHKPAAFLDNFSFYYGGGLHIGASTESGFGGGLDGVFGAEWIFPFASQFAVSLDVIPSVSFAPGSFWPGVSTTAGIKWIFAK